MATKKRSITPAQYKSLEEAFANADFSGTDVDAELTRQSEERQKASTRNNFATGVTSTVDSTAEPADSEEGLLGSASSFARRSLDGMGGAVDALQGALERSASSALFTDLESGDPSRALQTVAQIPEAFQDALAGDSAGALARVLSPTSFTRDTVSSLDQRAAANQQNVQAVRQDLEGRNTLIREGGETVLDIAESPTGLLSLIGGPVAAIGVADVFNQEYKKAREAGLNHDEAIGQAGIQAAPETLGFIPAERLLAKVPGLNVLDRIAKNKLSTMAEKMVARTVLTSQGEGIGEMATTAAQTAANAAMAQVGPTENMRNYAEQQLPQSTGAFVDSVWRSYKAGVASGTTFGGAHSGFEAAAEAGQMAADWTNTVTSAATDARNAEVNARRAAKAGVSAANTNLTLEPAQEDMFGVPSGLPSNEAYESDRAQNLLYDAQNLVSSRQEQARVRARDAEGQSAREQELVVDQEAAANAQEVIRFAEQNPSNQMAQRMADVARNNPRSLLKVQPVAAETAPAATAKAAVPTRPAPTQLELPVTQAQPIDNARAEAQKFVEKLNKKELDNAKSKRASARRNAMAAANQQHASLPANERVNAIASTMVDWDNANPVPTAETLAAQAKPVATPAPVAATVQPASTQPAVEEEPGVTDEEARAGYRDLFPDASDEDINRMIQEDAARKPLAMNQPARSVNGEVSIEDIGNAVGQRIGRSRGANTIAQLGNTGKLRLINNDAQIPKGADAAGVGWYDSDGNITVDARKINKDNVLGDLMSVVAHEGKHAADFSGAGRATLGNFVGKSANRSLNRQIEAAAKAGDARAQAAVDNARQYGGGFYDEELPAYYINEVRDGKETPLSQRIVSAVRVKARSALGTDAVNLKDVRYLSDKLLEQVATADSIAGGTSAVLPMIYNKNSKGFDAALAAGNVYDSVDGNQKYVLTDDDATIKPGAFERLQKARTGIPLGDIMEHDILYREHPEARDISIQPVESLPQGAFGLFDHDDNSITVSRKALRNGDVGLREAIMHEVQHFVQQRGGQAANFYDGLAAGNTELEGQFKEVTQANDAAARGVLDVAQQIKAATSGNNARAIDEVLFDRNLSDFRKANEIAGLAMDEGLQLPEDVQRAVNEFNLTTEQYRDLQPEVQKARQATDNAYRSNITEREAFFTQNNVNTPQRLLPTNPENEMRNQEADPETGFDSTQGRIDVPSRQTLAMARVAPAAAAVKANSTVGHDSGMLNALHGAINYTGGLGKDVRDQIDLSIGDAGAHAEQARHNMANLEAGIDRLASQWAKNGRVKNKEAGRKAVNEMILKRMDALEKVPQARRESAIAAFTRDYPELSAFARAYQDIGALTDTLADQVGAGKGELTPADKAFQQKLRDSKFGYTTRLYAAYQGLEGRKHSRKVLDNAAKAAEKLAKGKTVSDRQAADYKTYENAVNWLSDNELQIPAAEDMQKMTSARLNDLYNTWMPDQASDVRAIAEEQATAQGMNADDASAFARQTIIEQLDQKREDIQPEELRAKAEAAVKDMLGLTQGKSAVAQRVGGITQDRGILRRRENLPQELRDLFGEVRDPVTMLGVTQAKQGELVARTKLLSQLRDSGLVTTQDKAGTPGFEAYTEKLTGDTAGPLANMYTTPRVANAVKASLETYSDVMSAIANTWMNSDGAVNATARSLMKGAKAGAATSKAMSIILDGFNTAMNAAGSPITLMVNGVTSPKAIGQGAKGGISSIADQLFNGKGEINPVLLDGIRYGVVDSARTQELRRTATKYIRSKISEQPKALQQTRQVAGTVWATAVETFAMSDAWAKLAAFQDRTNYLTKFYKAEGIDRTEQQIKEEAGNDIRDSNITYGKTPPILRAAESLGITTFMPYFYNVPRSLVKSMYLGGRDLMRAKTATTPEGRNAALLAGVKRMSGTAAAMSLVPMVTKALAAHFNDDDDDVEEKKKTLRNDARYGDPVYLGDDKNGRPTFFRTSRLDPYGPVTDLIRIALDDNIDAATTRDAIVENIRGLAFTNRFVQAAAKGAGDQPITGQSRLERILPEPTSMLKQGLTPAIGYNGSKTAMQVLDSLLPGISDAADPNNSATTQPVDDWAAAVDALTRYTGGRVDRGDPAALARTAAYNIRNTRDNARAQLFDMLDSGASPASVADVIRTNNRKIYKQMAGLSDVYDGMVNGMDYSSHRAMDVLKSEGKLNPVEIANIRRNLPRSYEDEDLVNELGKVLSKKSVEQRSKKSTRNMTPEEAKQYEREMKQMLEQLRKEKNMKAGD